MYREAIFDGFIYNPAVCVEKGLPILHVRYFMLNISTSKYYHVEPNALKERKVEK